MVGLPAFLFPTDPVTPCLLPASTPSSSGPAHEFALPLCGAAGNPPHVRLRDGMDGRNKKGELPNEKAPLWVLLGHISKPSFGGAQWQEMLIAIGVIWPFFKFAEFRLKTCYFPFFILDLI